MRSRPRDDRPDRDDRGAVALLAGGAESSTHGRDILSPVDLLRVPAVGLVPLEDILAERDVGVALDGDVVVVVEEDEVAQPLMSGQRGRLARHALLHASVTRDAVDGVVEHALAGWRVRIQQATLAPRGHRHAHGVSDPLAERPCRGLDTQGVPMLGVPRREAAPLPKQLEIFDREAVAGQVQLDVQREAGVPGAEHEPVAAHPLRIRRVVLQELLEKQIRDRGQAHRRSRVARAGRLDSIHRQPPSDVHSPAVEIVRPARLGLLLSRLGGRGGGFFLSAHHGNGSSPLRMDAIAEHRQVVHRPRRLLASRRGRGHLTRRR